MILWNLHVLYEDDPVVLEHYELQDQGPLVILWNLHVLYEEDLLVGQERFQTPEQDQSDDLQCLLLVDADALAPALQLVEDPKPVAIPAVHQDDRQEQLAGTHP